MFKVCYMEALVWDPEPQTQRRVAVRRLRGGGGGHLLSMLNRFALYFLFLPICKCSVAVEGSVALSQGPGPHRPGDPAISRSQPWITRLNWEGFNERDRDDTSQLLSDTGNNCCLVLLFCLSKRWIVTVLTVYWQTTGTLRLNEFLSQAHREGSVDRGSVSLQRLSFFCLNQPQ